MKFEFEYDSGPTNLEELKKQQAHYMWIARWSFLFAIFVPLFITIFGGVMGAFLRSLLLIPFAGYVILSAHSLIKVAKLDELSEKLSKNNKEDLAMTKSKSQNHQDAIMLEPKENRDAKSINKGPAACTFEFLEDGLVKTRLDFFLEGTAADNAPHLSEHSAVTAVVDGLYINWKIFPSTAYHIAIMAFEEDNIELLHSNNICIEAFCVDNNDDSKEWRFIGRVGEEVRHTVTDKPMHCNQPSSINYLLNN